ncbi:HET-domain-containing protein, partial [Microthyrium microscopicum]
MRLLQSSNNGGFSFSEDFVDDEEIPPYAILSHTWGRTEDEVTFDDIINGTGQEKPGYDKIRFCREQAKQDSLQLFWIDTCCINKLSSAELTYAINSMFRWYGKAKVCYAYLSDAVELLRTSRWFTRGWTLQELLAPERVIFYDTQWARITDKRLCCDTISSITGIPSSVLKKRFCFWSDQFIRSMDTNDTTVYLWSTGMRWCSSRKTSRPEDTAYSLLGMFDVNLPLIYGEGEKRAFQRLQLEMVKRTSSNSLLAWNLDSEL